MATWTIKATERSSVFPARQPPGIFHFIHVLQPPCTAFQASTAQLVCLLAPSSTRAARPPSASQLPPHDPLSHHVTHSYRHLDRGSSPQPNPSRTTLPTCAASSIEPLHAVPSPYRPYRAPAGPADSKLRIANFPSPPSLADLDCATQTKHHAYMCRGPISATVYCSCRPRWR